MNTCKYCKSPVQENFYFCPNCGKKIKEPPFKFSVGKSITIIVAAFLLPPFGIIPGVKYFLKDDKRAQFVGIVTIAITIIVTIVSVLVAVNLINSVTKSYNDIMKTQSGAPVSTGNQQELINQIQQLQ